MPVVFHPLPTDEVRALQAGGRDAYGHAPERAVSDGGGAPCRHCLRHVPEGAAMLILAHCPFPAPQPYAETGPIFLCADACPAWDPARGVPPVLKTAPDYLIKGYGDDDRIVYGTGRVAPADRIVRDCETLFADPRVAYIHIRSARNNCYQARAVRGQGAR